MSVLRNVLKFYAKPIVRIPLMILLGLILLWGGLRSCSGGETPRAYYVIGRDVSWYPFDLLGKEQNMVGFTSDLIDEIEEKEKVRFEIVDVTSKSLVFGLDRGNWDAILSTMTPDAITRQRYNFSKPFYASGLVLVVRPDSPLKSFDDIHGKIIAIPKELNLDQSVAKMDAIFTPYSRISQGVEDMIANRLDAVIMDYVTAQLYAQAVFKGRIKLATTPLIADALRLVTRKTEEGAKIIKIFDTGLEKMVTDGSFAKLLNKWSLGSP